MGRAQRVKTAQSEPLLPGRERVEAAVEIGGAIPGQNLLQIGLERALALSELLGPALLGRLAVFRGNLSGIDQRLRSGGSRRKQCNGEDQKEWFQMSLRKSGILARGVRRLKPEGRYPVPAWVAQESHVNQLTCARRIRCYESVIA